MSRMYFVISAVTLCLSWIGVNQVHTTPVGQNVITNDKLLVHEYATLKHILIYDLGYTEEFADMVEINLKRAIREEKERQKLRGAFPDRLRQEIQASEEDDEDTTPAVTTIGPSPGDIVKGVATIITSLGTFNINSFWGSFVNFFPPAHRESAQAVADSAIGKRPVVWPTLPTTTTKLTTTTKDEDDIDSDESTPVPAAAATIASISATPGTAVSTATVTNMASQAVVTEAATKAPTVRYTVKPRTPGPSSGVTVFEHLVKPSSN